MSVSVEDRHELQLGQARYGFRTPRVHDGARLRRILMRQGVRRPDRHEFLIAGKAGVEQMAAVAGDVAEGVRQAELLERWHELTEPIDEDSIDVMDPVARALEVERLKQERQEEAGAIYADVLAIQANLERHHPPYGELKADQVYWDDVTRIEVVRLLLTDANGTMLPRDGQGVLTEAAYEMLPREHRVQLSVYAFSLMSPSETQRKN